MLEKLELTRFEGLVGQAFELLVEDAEPVALRLAEAGPVGELSAEQAAQVGKRLPFSLVFSGPAELFLPQGIGGPVLRRLANHTIVALSL